MTDIPATLERNMTENDWAEILYSIRNNKCILVVGPGAVLGSDGVPLLDKLSAKIATLVEGDPPDPHSDSIFTHAERLLKKRGGRAKLSDLLSEIYWKEEVSDLFLKISQIPIHLMINISPSHFLRDAFRKNGIPHQFAYYNYNKNMGIEGEKEEGVPLVYNLFGSLEDENSLVFTHEQLFDFIFEILGNKRMPDRVREEIVSALNFIFIGFNFESWYLKIILRLLESHTKEVSYAYPWKTDHLRESTKDFFEDNFRLDFVNSEIPAFIDELYKRCNEKEMLREVNPGGVEVNLVQRIRDLIGEDKVDDVLDELERFLTDKDNNDLLNDVFQLSGRYSRLMRSFNKKTITQADSDVEMNRITDALITLAENAVAG
jgi:hypothetical protein